MSLVCWSGGADSTLVLFDRLKDPEREKSDSVRAISVRHPQLVTNQVQRAARRKIRAELRRRNLTFRHVDIELRDNGGFSMEQYGLVQPVMWLGVVLPYLRKDENLYMGYVDGDSIWAWWAQLHAVFDNAVGMMNLGKSELKTPLYGVRKAVVLSRLRQVGLLNMTWTCERPPRSRRACGRCLPCKTRALARYELKRWPKAAKGKV